jgi:hypothetical protein
MLPKRNPEIVAMWVAHREHLYGTRGWYKTKIPSSQREPVNAPYVSAL